MGDQVPIPPLIPGTVTYQVLDTSLTQMTNILVTSTVYSDNIVVKSLSDGYAIMEGGFISNLNDPIEPQDAATKEYVDSHLINGGVISINSQTGYINLISGTNINIYTNPAGSFTINTVGTEVGGTVTDVSIVSANGFYGSVADPSSTPALTLNTSVSGILLGDGIGVSSATPGIDYQLPGNYITDLTGDIVANGPGSANSTIQNGVVLNTKLAIVPAATVKGNSTSFTTNPTDLSLGSVTENTSDVLVLSNWTTSVIGNPTIEVKQSSSTQDGYLSSTDWNRFNDNTGSAINALTGDGVAIGPGTAVFTLVNVNTTPGLIGVSSMVPIINVNSKGLTTISYLTPIFISESQVDNLVSDLAGKQPVGNYITTITGAVIASGPGLSVSSLGINSVYDYNLQSVPSATVKGNSTSFTTNPTDLSLGAVTESTSDVLVLSNWTTSVIGNPTIEVKQSNSTQDGYLSSTDWNKFNDSSSGGINALTGDGVAFGPGTAVFTLVNVNTTPGLIGVSSMVPIVSVNSKGLTTISYLTPIFIAESQVNNLVSDLAGKQPVGNYITNLTGDVVANGPGSVNATIQNGVVSNTKLATVPSATVKGNSTSVTTNPADLSLGSVTESTSNVLTLSNWTTSVIGNPTIQVKQATNTQSGYLSSTDWNTFNRKLSVITGAVFSVGTDIGVVTIVNQAVSNNNLAFMPSATVKGNSASPTTTPTDLSLGAVTESTSDVLILSNWTTAVIGNPTIEVKQSSSTQDGYLSSTDWNKFNDSSSGGINALTGDGVAFGPGTAVFTLVNVNTTPGLIGVSSMVPIVSVNSKGLTTISYLTPIFIAESQVNNLVSDLAGKQPVGNYITTITGAVIASGPGLSVSSLGINSVYNYNLQSVPSATVKGNSTSVTTNPTDLSLGSVTESTSNVLTLSNWTTSVIGNPTIQVKQATTSQSGYLSSTDWNTFNKKLSVITGAVFSVGTDIGVVTIVNQAVANNNLAFMPSATVKGNSASPTTTPTDLSLGAVTESTSDVLILSNWTTAVIGNPTIEVKQSSSTQDGYLSSTDWNTFNNSASGGITALTGAGFAFGPGTAVFNLINVNSTPGLIGVSSMVPIINVTSKGLTTISYLTPIFIAESQVNNLVSDLAGKQPVGNYITAITGSVIASGPGLSVSSLGISVVSNYNLAFMPSATVKGNSFSATTQPSDLTLGSVTESTSSVLTLSNWTTSVVGNPTIQVKQSGAAQSGYLSSTDWNTFNQKLSVITGAVFSVGTDIGVVTIVNQAVANNNLAFMPSATVKGNSASPTTTPTDLSLGAVTENTSDVLILSNWTTAVIGNPTIEVKQSGASQSGYLSSTDWNKFNDSSSGGINALTGDGIAFGPGTAVFTLVNVNTTPGLIGVSSMVPIVSVNSKGLTTISYLTPIFIAESQVNNLVSDLAGKQPVGNYITNLTGDVVANGPGSVNSTIQNGVVSNTKLATVPSATVKGNSTSVTTNPTDLSLGAVTESVSSVLTLSNWTTSVVGNPTIQVKQSGASQSGYLSSTDWNTFNNKQASGNYITSLTGAVVASGPNLSVSSIGISVVSNYNLAFMPSATVKGNSFSATTQPTDLTLGSVTESTSSVLTLSNWTTSVIGNPTIQVKQATNTQSGYLSSTDWNTFNKKLSVITGAVFSVGTDIGVVTIVNQAVSNNNLAFMPSATVKGNSASPTTTPTDLSLGSVTESVSSVLTLSNWTTSVIGNPTIQVKQAGASQSGYLSSTDWNTFNNTASAGGISVLTGDGFAIGPGTAVFTLVNVNTTPGLIGVSSMVPIISVNSKGLTTISYLTPIFIAESQVNNLVSDLAGKQPVGNYITNLTGDVVANGPGSVNSTIQNGVVSNAKLATMASATVKGNSFSVTTQPTDLSLGSVTESTSSVLTLSNWTTSVIGNPTIQVKQATNTQSGYLSSTDWNTFNQKLSVITGAVFSVGTDIGVVTIANQAVSNNNLTFMPSATVKGNSASPTTTPTDLSLGSVTESVSSVLTLSNWTTSVIGNPTIQVKQAGASQSGYLSSTDWNTFNNSASGGITALTGAGFAFGPGTAVFNLINVNSTPGLIGVSSMVPIINVTSKGLTTISYLTPIFIAESQVNNLVSDLAGKQPVGNYITAITGSVIASGPGLSVSSIGISVVSNYNLAFMPSATVKGNSFSATTQPSDLTLGSVTESTSSVLTLSNWTTSVVGNPTIQVKQSGAAQSGYLSSTDWNTFNQKLSVITGAVFSVGTNIGVVTIANQAVSNNNLAFMPSATVKGNSASPTTTPTDLSLGSVTESVSSVLTLSNWTTSVIGNPTIQVKQSGAAQSGYLSSTDWNTFNNSASGGITALTGAGFAFGPGTAVFTLINVNSTPGLIGVSSMVPIINVTSKGLTTISYLTPIFIAESQVNNLVSDLAGKQPVGNYITNLTGDVVANGPGSATATIQNGVVSNTKLATMASATVKGNSTSVTTQPTDLTLGSVTESTSSVLTLSNWTTSVIGNPTIQVKQATNTQSGYLSSTDWNTFNQKLSVITGAVFSVGTNIGVVTIANQAVANNNLTFMPSATVKGNSASPTTTPTDLSLGSVTESTSSVLTLTNWTTSVIGNPTIQVKQSGAAQSGYLSSTDWNTFNNKQAAGNYITSITGSVIASGPGLSVSSLGISVVSNYNLAFMPSATVKGNSASVTTQPVDLTLGSVTENTSSVLTLSNWTTSVIGNPTIQVKQAGASQSGYLSSTDWNTFNNSASGGITALTGAGFAFGPGTAVFTLINVNSTPGLIGVSSMVPIINVTSKGLTTISYLTPIFIAESQVNNLVSDLAGKQPVGNYITNLTGDVVANGPGSATATIQNSVVSNTKLATMASATVKGNSTSVTTQPTDLSLGSVTESTSSVLTLSNWTTSVIGNPTIQVKQSGAAQSGYLSSTDWNTFNNKQTAGNYITSITGSVIASGPGLSVSSLGISVVSNYNLAFMPSATVKGNSFSATTQPTDLTLGSVTENTSSVLTLTNWTTSVIGNPTIQVKQSGAAQSGYLSSTDWNTFNQKLSVITGAVFSVGTNIGVVTIVNQAVANNNLAFMPSATVKGNSTSVTTTPTDLSLGSVTESTSSVLTLSNWTTSVIGNPTIQVKQSGAAQSGYLSSTDWNTFNTKQQLYEAWVTNINFVTITIASLFPNITTTTTTIFKFTLIGAGGGGGSGLTTNRGSGGGGGGCGIFWMTGLIPTTPYSIRVGTNGVGGTGANGLSGGNTFIFIPPTTFIAGGGINGIGGAATSVKSGGAGGGTTNCTVSIPGQAGGYAIPATFCGNGGDTGGGFGKGGIGPSSAGSPGNGFGGGGQGSIISIAGNGTGGAIIIQFVA